MKKSKLMELLKNMYGRKFNQCSSDVLQSLPKKEFKEYVNANGGFSRGKVLTNSINAETKIEGVPEGSIYLEMELSDESENMNGYVIEIDAREKPDGLKKFFNDFGGKLLYQHNQQEPIGKTLDIGIREDATGRKYLRASAYAYDDYTENRLSRNLVTDISTSHLAFEIIFRNRETGEELSYEDFRILVDGLINKMIDEEKTFMEIWEAIQELRASYQERHRNVQLVEQSLVTIGSNKNAEIKKMRNSIEEMKELVSKNGLDGDEKVEKDDTETIEKDHITSQENVENEGETPSAGTNDTPPTTENGEGGEAPSTENGDGTSPSVEPNGETSENGEQPLEENAVALKATILDLQAKLKVVEDSNEQLKNEKAELEAKLNYQNSKVKVTKTDLKENTTAPTEEDINLARQGVRKLFRRV